MLLFVIWKNPTGRLPAEWSELILTDPNLDSFEKVPDFLRLRTGLNGAENYVQARNLDPLLLNSRIRVLPEDLLLEIKEDMEERGSLLREEVERYLRVAPTTFTP